MIDKREGERDHKKRASSKKDRSGPDRKKKKADSRGLPGQLGRLKETGEF